MKMPMVQLGKICDVTAGQPAPQDKGAFAEDGLPFIRAGSLDFLCNGRGLANCEKISEDSARRYHLKLYPTGTVVFAKSGMSATLGRVYCLESPAYIVSHLAAIIPSNSIESGFLTYYLQAHSPARLIPNEAYPSIRTSEIAKLKIPLLHINEQRRITTILDSIEAIRRKRHEVIDLINNMIKSQFIEMFGDPVTNPMGWDLETMNNLTASITAGESLNGEARLLKPGEKAVLKVSAVTYGYFNPNEYKVLLNPSGIKKYVYPQKGDLLFSRANTREMVGATALVFQDYPDLILPDKLWKLNFIERVNVFFMKFILSSDKIRSIISLAATGTSGSMYNVSMEKLRNLQIPVPPLDFQNRFADFVKQADKSKFIMHQELKELETLNNALMQQYFY